MLRCAVAVLCLLPVCAPVFAGQGANDARLDQVERLGSKVMPFDLEKTTHVFSKTPKGGVQQVVAKHPQDSEQIRLIREHLSQIAEEFSRRNFSGPESIHGKNMPGLAELRAAQAGELDVIYAELVDGARIDYTSDKPEIIRAIHDWFDAQLGDHARHAVAGHEQHHMQGHHHFDR
ncbi:MAG: hypothetical protein Kow0065_02280 [Methylomicrobium sp.]